jgi:serine/threonine protein kinase
MKSKRAEVYFMRDSGDELWAIKRFLLDHPNTSKRDLIKTLIPHRPGFEAGYMRRVLTQESISNPAFRKPPLSTWIENAVLMPAVKGSSWAAVSAAIIRGQQYLPRKHRLKLIRSLSEKIQWLEGQEISHRDISAANVCVDLKAAEIHLVDWDAIFHPSLPMPTRIGRGTAGYLAPFLNVSGVSDGRLSWKSRADRFGLALLNAEILSISAGLQTTGENGLCHQDELYNRTGPCLDAMDTSLRANYPRASVLLQRALLAESFEDCPRPEDWTSLTGTEPAAKPVPIPIRDAVPLTELNRALFTQQRRSSYTKLKRHLFAQPPFKVTQ